MTKSAVYEKGKATACESTVYKYSSRIRLCTHGDECNKQMVEVSLLDLI
jgi:hypothetical protein